MALDQDSDPPLDFPDSPMLAIDDLDTFSSSDIEITQEDQEDILSTETSDPMLGEQLPIMEEQEVEASSDTEPSLRVKAKDQQIRSEILKIKIRKPLKSGAAKAGEQVSIAKRKTEIISGSESESMQSDSMHRRVKKKKLQSEDDTLMEA
ncbi:hypothetical protein C0992_001017, partial [Termitomyces sp. T32_za158]